MIERIKTLSTERGLPFWVVMCLRSLPFQTVAASGLFWLYHDGLRSWMKQHAARLGALTYRHFVPFYAVEHVTWFTLWLIPASVVLIIYLLFVRWLYLRNSIKPLRLFMISILFFVLIGLSVAMIDGVIQAGNKTLPAVLWPFARTKLEYFGDVPRIDAMGVRDFLRHYASPVFLRTLSLHSRVHPPGGSLFQWLISKSFGYNLWSISLLSILFTGMTVIPVFLLARDLYGEMVGRYALALFLVVPNFVMFTTTSMDGPFSVFPIWAIYLYYHSIKVKRVIPWAALTGLAIALGMFMTYATFFLGLFFGVVLLFSLVFYRSRFKQEFVIAAIAFLVFVMFYLILFLLGDFNFFEALNSSAKQEQLIVGKAYPSFIHYLQISLGNVIVFLVGVGLPLTVAWFRQCFISLHRLRKDGASDIYVVGFMISLVVIAFSTIFKLEVERIWIFMVPFVVIPAAHHLHDLCMRHGNLFAFYWVSGLMCVQMVLGEAILWTYW